MTTGGAKVGTDAALEVAAGELAADAALAGADFPSAGAGARAGTAGAGTEGRLPATVTTGILLAAAFDALAADWVAVTATPGAFVALAALTGAPASLFKSPMFFDSSATREEASLA